MISGSEKNHQHPSVLRAESGAQDLEDTKQAVGTFGKSLASVGDEWANFLWGNSATDHFDHGIVGRGWE